MASDVLERIQATFTPRTLTAALALWFGDGAALALMGQPLWCACGSLAPWSWDIWSRHNSQHWIDPYTFTHVLHGALFYAGLWLAFGGRWPSLRALCAVGGEVLWELVENTDAVIQAYRESTVSLDYFGDSVANSLGDVLAFGLGYLGALSIPVWLSALTFFGVEAVLLVTIRDSLLLNVIMLVHPSSALKHWQLGG